MTTALITGATQGLGRALAEALAHRGWSLVLTARSAADLHDTARALRADRPHAQVVTLAGDVSDPGHRAEVVAAVGELAGPGGLDLLVNNASTLGPTPLRPLRDLDAERLGQVLTTNVVAPHALVVALLPMVQRAAGVVVAISSDAGVEHYETWGAYGASKAALDHLTLTLASEQPGIRAYALDPGDMRTAMHQAAFPGEDISDRPWPAEVAVPGLLALLDRRPPSGRYRAADLVAEAVGVVESSATQTSTTESTESARTADTEAAGVAS